MNGNSTNLLTALLLTLIIGLPIPVFAFVIPADAISNITPINYERSTLESGNVMFVDRDYVFSELPLPYVGMDQILTSKLDRTSTGNNFVSFEVNIPVTVYVAHDDLITNKPAWLQSWTDTGDDLVGRSIFRKDFQAGTIILGGNTIDGFDIGSMYMILIEPLSDSIPHAVPDSFFTDLNTAINIDVLANDSNLTDLPITVSVIEPPTNGTAILEADNTITYTPENGFNGTDSLFYKVVDANGDITIANISVDVKCSGCPTDIIVTLTWIPNTDDILGYAVYYGFSAETATQVISELPLNSGLIDPQSPNIQYHLANDLGLVQVDSICFRLKAYNEFGFSDYSSPACL